MRRRARTDRNHGEVVKALRAIGASVADRPAWRCAGCGKEEPATVHRMRNTYCSRGCLGSAYRGRMAGAANPNFRAAGNRACERCGSDYFSYDKKSKFCGQECYRASRPSAPLKPQKQPKPPRKVKVKLARAIRSVYGTCLECAEVFLAPRTANRLYCSYGCHLASGGAQRAGVAAKAATMKYGAKKDANHKEVFDALRKHCKVFDLSDVGRGLPDGIAWVRDRWEFFDVKNPKTGYGRRGLNKLQKAWVDKWQGGAVYLIYSAAEAERFGRGEFEGLKRAESACSGDRAEVVWACVKSADEAVAEVTR